MIIKRTKTIYYIVLFLYFFYPPAFAYNCLDIKDEVEYAKNEHELMFIVKKILKDHSDVCAFYIGEEYLQLSSNNKELLKKAEMYLLRVADVVREADIKYYMPTYKYLIQIEQSKKKPDLKKLQVYFDKIQFMLSSTERKNFIDSISKAISRYNNDILEKYVANPRYEGNPYGLHFPEKTIDECVRTLKCNNYLVIKSKDINNLLYNYYNLTKKDVDRKTLHELIGMLSKMNDIGIVHSESLLKKYQLLLTSLNQFNEAQQLLSKNGQEKDACSMFEKAQELLLSSHLTPKKYIHKLKCFTEYSYFKVKVLNDREKIWPSFNDEENDLSKIVSKINQAQSLLFDSLNKKSSCNIYKIDDHTEKDLKQLIQFYKFLSIILRENHPDPMISFYKVNKKDNQTEWVTFAGAALENYYYNILKTKLIEPNEIEQFNVIFQPIIENYDKYKPFKSYLDNSRKGSNDYYIQYKKLKEFHRIMNTSSVNELKDKRESLLYDIKKAWNLDKIIEEKLYNSSKEKKHLIAFQEDNEDIFDNENTFYEKNKVFDNDNYCYELFKDFQYKQAANCFEKIAYQAKKVNKKNYRDHSWRSKHTVLLYENIQRIQNSFNDQNCTYELFEKNNTRIKKLFNDKGTLSTNNFYYPLFSRLKSHRNHFKATNLLAFAKCALDNEDIELSEKKLYEIKDLSLNLLTEQQQEKLNFMMENIQNKKNKIFYNKNLIKSKSVDNELFLPKKNDHATENDCWKLFSAFQYEESAKCFESMDNTSSPSYRKEENKKRGYFNRNLSNKKWQIKQSYKKDCSSYPFKQNTNTINKWFDQKGIFSTYYYFYPKSSRIDAHLSHFQATNMLAYGTCLLNNENIKEAKNIYDEITNSYNKYLTKEQKKELSESINRVYNSKVITITDSKNSSYDKKSNVVSMESMKEAHRILRSLEKCMSSYLYDKIPAKVFLQIEITDDHYKLLFNNLDCPNSIDQNSIELWFKNHSPF